MACQRQGPLAQQRRVAGLPKGLGLSNSVFGIHVKPSPAGKSAGTHGHANRDSLNLESSRGGDARCNRAAGWQRRKTRSPEMRDASFCICSV